MATFAFCMAGCKHHADRTATVTLDKTGNITDETGLIARHPSEIMCFRDNKVCLLIPPNKLLCYNFDNHKLDAVFDTIAFNIDSAVSATYRIHNGIDYLPHDAKALKNENKSLYKLFHPAQLDSGYMIPVIIRTLSLYDPATVAKTYTTKRADSLRAIYGNASVTVGNFLYFVIKADENMHQQQIMPIYSNVSDAVISLYKRIYFYNNKIYSPLLYYSLKEVSDTTSMKSYSPSYYFNSFDISNKGLENPKALISKRLIKLDNYTKAMHAQRRVSYAVNNNELIASMGLELLNLTKDSTYRVQPILDEKEYISNFSVGKNEIIYLTEKYVPAKVITPEMSMLGATDSLAERRLKIQDVKSNSIILSKSLEAKGVYTISSSQNIYEYLEKGNSLVLNKYSIKYND